MTFAANFAASFTCFALKSMRLPAKSDNLPNISMKKKSGKDLYAPKFATHSLDRFLNQQPKLPAVSKHKEPEIQHPKASLRRAPSHSNSISQKSVSDSDQHSQGRQRLRRLVRHNDDDEDQEFVVPANKSEQGSVQDSGSEVDVPGQGRFLIGDIEELKQEEKNKKLKLKDNKRVDEMIKKEKSQPKKEKKPSEKFSDERKAQLKEKLASSRKKPEKGKEEEPIDDKAIDSEEQRQIRINKVKAQQDKELSLALKLSREEAELQKAIELSKKEYQNSGKKTAAHEGSEAEIRKGRLEEEEQTDLLERYARGKQEVQSKKQEQTRVEVPKPRLPQTSKNPKSKTKEEKEKGPAIKGPLTGKTFVLTGVFPEGKDKIEKLLENLGAAVRGSVSGKTHYLIQGTVLEDGREPDTSGKSKKAVELGTKIVKYDDFDELMIKLTDKSLAEHFNYKAPPPLKPADKMETEPVINKAPGEHGMELWVERYAPKRLGDIIGQNAQIHNLREWLSTWERVHVQGIKHEVKPSYGYNPFAGGNINCTAALISGDPGIGKTTAAKLICEELGFDSVEFNASDTRNKSSVLGIQFNSMTLDKMGKSRKRVVIMDEVDGMSAGDRGGIQAIIQTIKKTRAPVICICNDRQHDKIKTLAGHCYDIKFSKPKPALVVKRLMDILAIEGLSVNQATLTHIVESFNSDFRQILNYLDMTSRTHDSLGLQETKGSIKRNMKDTLNSLNKWQASLKLLNRAEFSQMNIRSRLDIFFTDTDMVPLMVQDCLIASMSKKPKYTTGDMRQLVKAYDSICMSDVLGRCIRMEQQWSLMPLQGFLSCIYPTEMVSNAIGATKFPEWLGKNSTTRKFTREVRELKNAMSLQISGNNRAVAQDYSPAIVRIFLQAMEQEDIDGILDFMESYRLTPQLLKEHLLDVQYNPKKVDMMAGISSQTKSRLTKEYNRRHENSLKLKKSKQQVGSDGGARYNDLLDEIVNESGEEVEEQAQADQNSSSNVEVVTKQSKKGKSKPKKK